MVAIAVEQTAEESPVDPNNPQPPGPSKGLQLRRGLGTGFIVRSDGYIVTNCHVVENAVRIEVAFGSGSAVRRVPARLVGRDEPTDLALLKIEVDHPLPTLSFGDSGRLEIAQWVMAIGNPYGLSQTVTVGVVSQLGREDISPQGRSGYFDFIQTDAPMNPGSSGGPLLDASGRVVGIANAVHSTGQGIGFAIPAAMAKAILPQLYRSGRVVRSWMGISVEEVPGEVRRLLGLGTKRGVLVSDVMAGGPAERAGVRIGDLIVGYEGRAVGDPHRIRWLVATSGVGHRVRMKLFRSGREIGSQVTLVEMPEPAILRPAPAIPGLGLAVEAPRAAGPFQEAFGGEGARVARVEPGSAAFAAGLRKGDLVAGLNGRKIHTPAGLLAATLLLPSGAPVRLLVRRAAGLTWVSFAKAD